MQLKQGQGVWVRIEVSIALVDTCKNSELWLLVALLLRSRNIRIHTRTFALCCMLYIVMFSSNFELLPLSDTLFCAIRSACTRSSRFASHAKVFCGQLKGGGLDIWCWGGATQG